MWIYERQKLRGTLLDHFLADFRDLCVLWHCKRCSTSWTVVGAQAWKTNKRSSSASRCSTVAATVARQSLHPAASQRTLVLTCRLRISTSACFAWAVNEKTAKRSAQHGSPFSKCSHARAMQNWRHMHICLLSGLLPPEFPSQHFCVSLTLIRVFLVLDPLRFIIGDLF